MAIVVQDIYDKYTKPRVDNLAIDTDGEKTVTQVIEEQIDYGRVALNSLANAVGKTYSEDEAIIGNALVY